MDPSTQAQRLVVEIQKVNSLIAITLLPVLKKQVDGWKINHGGYCHGHCGQELQDWVAQVGGLDRVALGRVEAKEECCKKLTNIQSLLSNFDCVTKDLESKIRLTVNEMQRVMLVWKQWEQTRKFRRVDNPVSLHVLQIECFEKLLPLILNWKAYAAWWIELSHQVRNPIHTPRDLVGEVTQLISKLLNEAFVVVQQPYHVLKTAKMVQTPIVALLLKEVAGLKMSFSNVTTSIVWEDQVQELSLQVESVMDLDKSKVALDLVTGSTLPGRQAYFKDLKVMKVERKRLKRRSSPSSSPSPDTKGQLPHKVTEEVCYMLFEAIVTIGGGLELDLCLRTLSLPIAAGSSHHSQDADCDGHVMWYYAFGVMQPGGWISPPPKEVPWSRLVKVISSRFELELGKGLKHEEHIACLKERLLGPDPAKVDDKEMVTLQQFCESKLRWKVKDREGTHDFSFWTWVYKAMSVIRMNLKTLWGMEECHVGFGFIRGERAEAMLKGGRPGTYLIRFSNTRLGGISVSVVRQDKSVFHMEPLDYKVLKTKSVLSYFRLVDGCDYLYPDIQIHDSVYDEHEEGKRAAHPTGTLKYGKLVKSVPQSPSVVDPEELMNRLLDGLMFTTLPESPNGSEGDDARSLSLSPPIVNATLEPSCEGHLPEFTTAFGTSSSTQHLYPLSSFGYLPPTQLPPEYPLQMPVGQSLN